MTKKFAFTLAEVLIALAIIGVVAAMTIPTFMANTAGAQFRTGFKKGITVLTQAASANYATEGYDFGGTNVAYGTTSKAAATNGGGSAAVTDHPTIGFETTSYADNAAAVKNLDMVQDAQSLFHLFQGNLNMKNSNEIADYEVGIPDVALNCVGDTTIKITVPGTNLSAAGVTTSETGKIGPSSMTAAGTGWNEPSLADRSKTSGKEDDLQAVGGIAPLCAGGTINQGRMFMLEDGMVFTYDAGQASCTEGNPCFGYIDVNGPQGPNKLISCSRGSKNLYLPTYGKNASANMLMASCTVDAKDITDIYPVLFYGSTVKPASLAAKAVLYSQKSNQVTTTTP